MNENEQKIPAVPLNGQVRLRSHVAKDIKEIAARANKFSYEIVEEAIDLYKSIVISGNRGVTEKEKTSDKASDKVPTVELESLQITTEDDPWVRKLLQVRRSAKPSLPSLSEANLNEAVWADHAWAELRKHKSPLVSAEAPRAGGRGATPVAGAGDSDARSGGASGAGPDTDIARTIERVKAAQAERGRGKKGRPGKTG